MDYRIKCKLCGEKHSLREPHVLPDSKKIEAEKPIAIAGRKLATVNNPLADPNQSVNRLKRGQHCPTCTCKGKQVYEGSADRQRAYRQRKKRSKINAR